MHKKEHRQLKKITVPFQYYQFVVSCFRRVAVLWALQSPLAVGAVGAYCFGVGAYCFRVGAYCFREGAYCFRVGAYYIQVGTIVLSLHLLFSMMWVLFC